MFPTMPIQGVSEIFDQGDEHFDFRALPTFGNDHDHIIMLDHTQVTMNGVCSMHEYGRGSGTVQGCNNFLSYDGAFPNPTDYQFFPSCHLTHVLFLQMRVE